MNAEDPQVMLMTAFPQHPDALLTVSITHKFSLACLSTHQVVSPMKTHPVSAGSQYIPSSGHRGVLIIGI